MFSGLNIQKVYQLLHNLDDWLQTIALQYGYLGIFTISLIGSSSIILPIPYTIIIFSIGSLQIMNPFLIAISAGIGSALGEFIGYILGYYGRTIVSEENKKKMMTILKVFSRYGALTIFLFALTPLPDDLLFIPLGIMKYNFIKAFIPSLLGKMLMCFILAYGGHFSIDLVEKLIGGEGGPITIIVSTILLVIVIVGMFKIDWEKLLGLEKTEE